jgi:hypothetical protein
MKTSIKILLSFLGLCLLFITIILIVIKVDLKHKLNKRDSVLPINFEGITTIIATTPCNIEVSNRKDYSVQYSINTDSLQNIAYVDTARHALVINANYYNDTVNVPRIKIHMPSLKQVIVSSRANITLLNFYPDTLKLEANEQSTIIAKCKPNNYILKTTGNSFVELNDSKNVTISLFGNSSSNFQSIYSQCVVTGSVNDSASYRIMANCELITNVKVAQSATFEKLKKSYRD